MSDILDVTLELLRPGPAHNQLLSPLTPYLALCGADGPVTIHLPFEHRQLLSRLQRLRYSSEGKEIAEGQREAELREMGETLGRVFAQVPALLSELGNARFRDTDLVHLRLSISAFELALVPFEVTIGADGFPGSGSPLFVQSIAPITMTREVRRGRPLPVQWNRTPRILFAFASPNGLPMVPAEKHLNALRRAIEPWVEWKPTEEKRIEEVKKILTILPNASLQQIRKACAETEYTHVHILAHGEQIGREDDHHYGIALCHDGDSSRKDSIDGEALATALTAKDSLGSTGSRPTLVSLATCDSGHAGSVISPVGSIAHALHAGGIPWVIASQFPLWMNASSIAVDILYTGLLRGDDPRWVLYLLRQRLRTDSAKTHDWASIVAYAVIPEGFKHQVELFRNRQTRQSIESKFKKAEETLTFKHQASGAQGAALPQGFVEPEEIYKAIREDLRKWREDLSGLEIASKSERLGMSASGEKRIGNLHKQESNALRNQGKIKESEYKDKQAREAYEKALTLYEQALRADPMNHWVATQFLSLLGVLTEPKGYSELAKDYGHWWTAARWVALQQVQNTSGEKKAWALGTLAELELLGVVYNSAAFDPELAQKTIAQRCSEICQAIESDRFPIFSTRRQFQRYLDYWPQALWKNLAEVAVAALPEGPSWVGRAYLP